EELEQRGLWRRAAARWQELLLNYLQEDDRICIQRRIQHCLKRAKMKSQRATSQEEFSFRLLRSSAIQTEKEMGISSPPGATVERHRAYQELSHYYCRNKKNSFL
ncbi:TPA: PerC family transcriptional regulator, partial [Escherichia coli]